MRYEHVNGGIPYKDTEFSSYLPDKQDDQNDIRKQSEEICRLP